MTFPLRLQLGPAVLEAHFVFELLAYFLGYRYYVALRRREGDAVGDDARGRAARARAEERALAVP